MVCGGAAVIEWICKSDHVLDSGREVATVTVYERRWAFCGRGGSDEHDWQEIKASPVEWVRVVHRPSEVAVSSGAG